MIVTEAVSEYLSGLRAHPDAILQEMEDQGAREHIPIVVPETGALLHVLAVASGAKRVLEVGTAIGVSTLYLARALPDGGQVVSFEIDAERQAAARDYLDRAGVVDRVDLRLQDAREGLASLDGSFDMAFVDGVKAQYGQYFDGVLPLLRSGGLLAVDNVLMSGTVAEGRGDAFAERGKPQRILQRIAGGDEPPHPIEPEPMHRQETGRAVRRMRRIERAAEQADAHAAAMQRQDDAASAARPCDDRARRKELAVHGLWKEPPSPRNARRPSRGRRRMIMAASARCRGYGT